MSQQKKLEHIAIIMDGNRRWAKQRLLPTKFGHRAGAARFKKLLKATISHDIKFLSLFAFSTENWQRSETEVNDLLELFSNYIINEQETFHKYNIRFNPIGDLQQFPKDLTDKINNLVNETHANDALILNLAINYGGRWDILNAVKRYVADLQAGKQAIEEIKEATFSQYLSTANMPDPDLLIRTSGECRLSNFLLWQSAYSELLFTDKLWPDFDQAALEQVIETYYKRTRRYGGE